MADHYFETQKGTLSLENDAFIRSFTKKKRVPRFAAIAHGFIACTSLLGIAFSALAYIISDSRNTIARYPEKSLRVAISLLIPIFWPKLHVLLFGKFSEGSLGLFCTAQDILMIIVLIYFTAVSTTTLADNNPKGTCDAVTIAGLVCAYLVALFHLIQLSVRVISFIIDLSQGPESSYLAKRLYKKGYSTSVAIYTISACISLIGFSMILWSYDFLSIFAKGNYHYSDIHTPHNFAVFDALAILHFAVPVWLLANVYSVILSSKTVPMVFAAIYDFCLGISILTISNRCFILLNNLDKACPNGGHCLRIWTELRPRQLAAIVLGFVVGLIHVLVCLFTCFKTLRLRINNTHRSNTLLHRLKSSNFNDISFLHNHAWTDDEVLSLFRIKGLTDDARDCIVSVLYSIHDDDVSHAQRISDKRNCDNNEKASFPWDIMRHEKDAVVKL